MTSHLFIAATALLIALTTGPLCWASGTQWSPVVDHEFMLRAVGKTVQFEDPESPIGVPNCVAAALRAGGYLPAFALSGTDSFYENDLPGCFRRIDLEKDAPQAGDLGVIYVDSVPTLAHAVLFIGEDKIFEKPSPEEKDPFRFNSWKDVLAKNQAFDNGIRGEIWRFTGGKQCALTQVNKRYLSLKANDLLRLAVQEIENRIQSGDWSGPSRELSKKMIDQALADNERSLKAWSKRLGRPLDVRRDWSSYRWFAFREDVLKLLKYAPAFR